MILLTLLAAGALGQEERLLERARVFYQAGEYAKALALLSAAPAPPPGALLGCHVDLALTLNVLGRNRDAIRHTRSALKLLRAKYKGDHPDIATQLDNLAFSLYRTGRTKEALERYEEELLMRRRLATGDDASVAKLLARIAEILQEQEHLAKALPNWRDSLAMLRRIHKGDHPAVSSSLQGTAMCLVGLRRIAEAMPLFQRSLQIYRRRFPGDHPGVAKGLRNIAMCLVKLDSMPEARTRQEQATAMLRRLGGAELYLALADLAVIHLITKETNKAVPLLEEAIQLVEQRTRGATLGAEARARYRAHLRRAPVYESMVLAQIRLGKHTEALRYLERARRQGDTKRLAVVRRVREQLRSHRLEVDRLAQAVIEAGLREDLPTDEQAALIKRLRVEHGKTSRALRMAGLQRDRIAEALLPEVQPATPAEIRAYLRKGERLLAYAFTEARKALRRKYPQPFFWAPFIYMGDPR